MIRLIVLIMQAMALAAFAAGPPLHDFCQAFNGASCEVVWKAPTNQIPVSVKILKVVPTTFSTSTVSNLLQLAGLTQNDRMHLVRDGILGEKDVLTFMDRSDTRHVDLIPSQGAIGLKRNGAFARIPKEMPSGVPDDGRALKLALDVLGKIGISKSELATDSNGKPRASFSEGSVIHKDKATGQIGTNIVDRSISLSRQIGGIPCFGMGGISMKFGNEGKIANLEAAWRAVKPDKDCPVPNASEFVNRVRSGRALIRSEQADAAYKKLTIEKLQLYYWENDGSERQERIYPFAVLETKTDQPGENANVQLFVSLTE